MLRHAEDYRDPGPVHLNERDRRRAAQRLLNRLRQLGYALQLLEIA